MKESELKENGNKNNINPNKAGSSTTNSNANPLDELKHLII